MVRKRNIVLLTIDCLRPDHLSLFGHHRKTSPNIDNLAKEGVAFRQAISNGAGTSTGFPPLLTSNYSLIHPYIELEKGKRSSGTFYLSDQKPTLAQALMENGYSTLSFLSNPFISSFFNYDKGFEIFEDFLQLKINTTVDKINRMLRSREQTAMYHLFKDLYLAYAELRGHMPYERSDTINENAIESLKAVSKPFFLWLHYMDVHEPYHPRMKGLFQNLEAVYLNREVRRLMQTQMARRLSIDDVSRKKLEKILDLYDKAIMYADQNLGDLVHSLEKFGFSIDNTLFIITADHGEEFIEHGRFGHGYLYDETIRVPLILCGPGIDGGLVIDDPVELLDFGPTILELMGIDKPKDFQGRSLVPLMNGRRGSRKRGVISETKYYEFSYRTEDWKYICYHHGTRTPNNEPELYNLSNDPLEKNDVAKNNPDKVDIFESEIIKHIALVNKMSNNTKTLKSSGL